jgi:hypothetical protein
MSQKRDNDRDMPTQTIVKPHAHFDSDKIQQSHKTKEGNADRSYKMLTFPMSNLLTTHTFPRVQIDHHQGLLRSNTSIQLKDTKPT